MKPQATSMVVFGYAFLAAYLSGAIGFWLAHDHTHAAMFLGGSVIWIVCLFIWNKNVEDGT